MAFSIPLGQLAEKMKEDLVTLVRKVTFDVDRKIVLKSPRDTGRFAGNWNASYGAPNYTVTNSTDPNRGLREAERAATLPVGGIVYFANGLPYGPVLEYGGYPNPPKNPTGKTVNGYSIQAPQGFVRLTALEFEDSVRKALAK